MMRTLPYLITALILTVCVTSGCVKGEVSAYGDVALEGWSYGDTVTLTCDSTSISPYSNMYLSLTHNNNYPYRNIWLEISYIDQDSLIRVDSVNIELCDKYGRWYGKGFGPSYQIETQVPGAILPPPGSKINVRHIMRTDTLRGIEKIGMSLRP